MPNLQFYIVDVFAETKYTGNQLAVVRGAAGLSTEEMLVIAQEMNYAESTFILSDAQNNGGYDVRIFTVTREMPFAGHPTLGTAYIINNEILSQPTDKMLLNYVVGQIPVTFHEDGIIWMRHNPPVFRDTFDQALIAEAIGLTPEDFNPNFPVQLVSTGIPFIIVPLKSLAAIKKVQLDNAKVAAIRKQIPDLDGVLVFSPETYHAQNQLNVRVLFDGLIGEPEDAATGAANGCFAAYLSRHRYFGTDIVDCRVEQGYEINRRSLLLLKAHEIDGQVEVNVGGKVFLVARGELVR